MNVVPYTVRGYHFCCSLFSYVIHAVFCLAFVPNGKDWFQSERITKYAPLFPI